MTQGQKIAAAGGPLYHTTSMCALVQYIRTSGVLCREDLLVADPETTPFYSDPRDRAAGVLARSFANLADFGAFYARAHAPTSPNLYGVIQLEFSPPTWPLLSDLVLTRQSIVKYGAAWRAAALNDGQVDDLLAAKAAFGDFQPPYNYAEASSSSRSIDLATCQRIIVEPLTLFGHRLIDLVQAVLNGHRLAPLVVERTYTGVGKQQQIQAIVDFLCGFTGPVDAATMRIPLAGVQPGLAAMDNYKRERFERWAAYFFLDTVEYLRRVQTAPIPSAEPDAEDLAALREAEAAFAEAEHAAREQHADIDAAVREQVSDMLAEAEVHSVLLASDEGEGTVSDYGDVDGVEVDYRRGELDRDSLSDIPVVVTFSGSTFDVFVESSRWWFTDETPDGHDLYDGGWSDNYVWATYSGGMRVLAKATVHFERGDSDDLRVATVEVSAFSEIEVTEGIRPGGGDVAR